jgi:hypothetical protein
MEKLITSFVLGAFIKNKKTVNIIVDALFEDEKPKKVNKPKVVKKVSAPKKIVQVKQVVPQEVFKTEDYGIDPKKKEVMDAIKYLKSKGAKTKAEKEKIQMLEVILKSM